MRDKVKEMQIKREIVETDNIKGYQNNRTNYKKVREDNIRSIAKWKNNKINKRRNKWAVNAKEMTKENNDSKIRRQFIKENKWQS